jgi:hypothetical protein
MNKPPYDDDDIDAWLARREPLFRRSHAGDDLEPPNEIDNVVLAQARAALRDSQHAAERRSPLPAFFTLDQWALPLGLAATLIVAVAVVIRVNPDEAAIAERIQDSDAPASPVDMDEPPGAPDAAASTAQTVTETVAVPQKARPQVSGELSRQRSNREEKLEADAAADAVKADVSADAAVAETRAPQEPVGGAFASVPTPLPAPPPPAAAAAPAGARAAQSAAENEQDPRGNPILWYQRIVELRAKGDAATADKEWRELQDRYPSFVPPDREPAPPR